MYQMYMYYMYVRAEMVFCTYGNMADKSHYNLQIRKFIATDMIYMIVENEKRACLQMLSSGSEWQHNDSRLCRLNPKDRGHRVKSRDDSPQIAVASHTHTQTHSETAPVMIPV